MTDTRLQKQLIPEERNRNTLWCRIILEELRACGLTHVILCPGGRSSAMAFALAHQPEITTLVHTDERSAAFFALGLIKARGTPAAVCTTSGSAVANILPAVLEADYSNLPLILLTCDRPRSQRDSGAPQTADHAGLCRTVVRLCLDLDEVESDEKALLALRRQISGIRRNCTPGAARGPVHVNVPLRGSITSMDRESDWERRPLSDEALNGRRDEAGGILPMIDLVAEPGGAIPPGLDLRPGLRGIIVAGSDSVLTPRQMGQLADLTGFPLLADAPSGCRRPRCSANLVSEADALTFSASFPPERTELIIRLGLAPISVGLQRFLASQACPTLRIVSRARPRDFLSRNIHTLETPSDGALEELGNRLGPGDRDWLQLWLKSGSTIAGTWERFLADAGWGECQAAQAICNAPGFDFIHLANSMSIRHGNLFCRPSNKAQRTFANRGVNGIDGTLGTFFGELVGTGRRGLLLVGDLAMLHDLPALEAAKHQGLRGVICLIDNAGGGLFDLVGCHDVPDYERLIRNPQRADFTGIARSFGIASYRCESLAELASALAEAGEALGILLIHVVVPPDSLKRDVAALYAACFPPRSAPTRRCLEL